MAEDRLQNLTEDWLKSLFHGKTKQHYNSTCLCKPVNVQVVLITLQHIKMSFDCTATYQDVSISQEVFQGPDLLNVTYGVILHFCFGMTAVKGNTEGLSYQVQILKHQRIVL